MSNAFIFPGQGSQSVGMGKDLAENFPVAKQVFDEVDDAVGHKLSSIIWDGPEDDLKLTENTQPALMAVSMAVMKVLEAEHGFSLKDNVKYVAGHSLGEYSALAAAGALSLSDTAKLLQIRGQAMQKAVPVGQGGMAALLGVDVETAQKIAELSAQGDVCQTANDNCPGQVVISGSKAAIERSVEIAKENGAKRAVILPVSAPFHSVMMQPAADVMAQALADVTINAPVVPVVCNVTAQRETSPEKILENLVKQVTGTVRWRESMDWLTSQDVMHHYEIGAGKVLRGLARQINRDFKVASVSNADDISTIYVDFKG